MALFSANIYELRNQAKTHARKGEYDAAINIYRKLVKKDPAHIDLYGYHLGLLYGNENLPCNNDEEALFWYAKVQPDTISKEEYGNVLRYLGNINRRLGRKKESLSFYEKADQMEDPLTQLVLGYLYNTGDRFYQDTEKAIHYYKRAIKNGNVDAMIELSDIYKKSPDTVYEALTLLTNAWSKNHPNAKDRLNQVFSEISTQDLRTLCRSMPEEKLYGDERYHYLAERARRNDPSCFYAYALILKKRGLIPEAIDAFKKSPAKKLGDAYFELGKLTEGSEKAQYFEKCIQYGLEHEITTTTKKAMTKLALYYKELGQLEKAIEYNEMAISHGYSLGYLRLGEIYRERKDECAEEYFLKAYETGRQKMAAMYLYEYAYERGDYAAAKKWCDETPQKEGNQKLYRLAKLYWNGKGVERDEDKAIDLLKQAIETKDCPEEEAKLALLVYYTKKDNVNLDMMKEAFHILQEFLSERIPCPIGLISTPFIDIAMDLSERVDECLPPNPSYLDYFALAELLLSIQDSLVRSEAHAIPHIIAGLGYSWEEAEALYTPPRYSESLAARFKAVYREELCGASRYQLIEWYRPLAEQGHVESMYRLYNQLIAVTKYGTPGYKEVSKWLDEATKHGHPLLQDSIDTLVGFIVHSASDTLDFLLVDPYHTEAIVRLARHCEEKGDPKHLAAARLLYMAAVSQYENMTEPVERMDGTFSRFDGYRYYRIYNLYCTSLIQDKEKANEYLEKMPGWGYPPALLVWLRHHHPHPLNRYNSQGRTYLQEKYKKIFEWGEIKAGDYL